MFLMVWSNWNLYYASLGTNVPEKSATVNSYFKLPIFFKILIFQKVWVQVKLNWTDGLRNHFIVWVTFQRDTILKGFYWPVDWRRPTAKVRTALPRPCPARHTDCFFEKIRQTPDRSFREIRIKTRQDTDSAVRRRLPVKTNDLKFLRVG